MIKNKPSKIVIKLWLLALKHFVRMSVVANLLVVLSGQVSKLAFLYIKKLHTSVRLPGHFLVVTVL